MPIYEFECSDCGHVFDRLQKLSDPDPSFCPQCKQAFVKRRVTAPAFRLAGSGWYETDFKSGKEKKRNLAGTEATKAETSAAGGETKADTKPSGRVESSSAPSAKPDKPAAGSAAPPASS